MEFIPKCTLVCRGQTVPCRGQRINMDFSQTVHSRGSKNKYGIYSKLYPAGVKEYIWSFSQTVHSRCQRIHMELFPNLDTPGVNEYIWRFSQTVLSRGQRINMELFPNCTLQGSKNTNGIFPKLYTPGVK